MKKMLKMKDLFVMCWISIILVIFSMYLIFIWSPVEKYMGVVQKIFYFHVASAWNAFFAFFIVFVFSILFLIKRKRIYDIIAYISAEIGVVFTSIVLTTGPIWGRSAWNTWWTWEPRLTTTLILWFIYIAYLMIRRLEGSWDKKARFASVFGILGFVNVPIVYMSIRWWDTKLHPVVFGNGVSAHGGGIEPEMMFTLFISIFALSSVFLVLLRLGIIIEQTKIKVQYHKNIIFGEME